jgi:hypothetical protein
VVPCSRYTWSGAVTSSTQVVRRAQFVQPVAKPSLGFRQAAAVSDVTVRSFQPHWPVLPKI